MERRNTRLILYPLMALVVGISSIRPLAGQANGIEYRVLATNRTSTMEKELNAAAGAGYRFKFVMGGETGVGGQEVVTVMERRDGAKPRFQYRLIAANRTSTMQKELQEGADAGYEYRGQTVFESLLGGKEVACILEKDLDQETPVRYSYRLLSTTRTSTMQREMQEAAQQGYEILGLTVGKTAMGGSELVTIARRRAQ